MTHPFFNNTGPFKIDDILDYLDLLNTENYKSDLIYDVKDLSSAKINELTNELINQLQQASSSGATSLPSRDIPSNPVAIANDVEVKPNFIPQASSNEDYINT